MSFQGVLVTLNDLKKRGIIQDYAIGGGYAVMFYDIPITTYDVDVLVVLPSEDDYHRLYEHFRERGAKIEDVYIFIMTCPFNFYPTT